MSDRDTVSSAAQEQGLSERLHRSVLPLWRHQLHHPFVVALGDGSLPQANFAFYIRQDALFLNELTKAFAWATTKTTDYVEMEQFGRYLLQTLLVEADLHHRYGEQFGLTPQDMAATAMTPTANAYTRHLLTIAATGTLPELLTAILPCAWIYAKVGHHLTAQTPPAPDHPYQAWLATYAAPDFDAVGLWLRNRLDAHAANQNAIARLHQIFLL